MAKNEAPTQTVGFLLVPGFALMSYAAAIEPLRAANLIAGKELYCWWHAAPGGKPVMASNGLAIIPDCGTDRDRAAVREGTVRLVARCARDRAIARESAVEE